MATKHSQPHMYRSSGAVMPMAFLGLRRQPGLFKKGQINFEAELRHTVITQAGLCGNMKSKLRDMSSRLLADSGM